MTWNLDNSLKINKISVIKLHYGNYGKWNYQQENKPLQRLKSKEATSKKTICYSNDATQLYTYKMYRQLQMEFSIKKCAMLIIKGGANNRRNITIKLGKHPDIYKKKRNYKNSEIMEVDYIKQEKVSKENLRRIRKLLKSKLCNRSLIKGIYWQFPLQDILYNSLNGQGRNSNKWTKGQEIWWWSTKLYSWKMT